jgi:hypothetical protein
MRLSVGTLRQVVKRDLPITFVPQRLTSYGRLELMRRYLRRIALPRRLQPASAALGGDYGSARLALLLLALPYVAPGGWSICSTWSAIRSGAGSRAWPACRRRGR